MKRAYSLLTIKSISEDKRIIEGVATTPSPDLMGDIIEPRGAEFTLPIPLLYQHNAKQPIGHVTAAKVTDAGIKITAQIAKGVAPFIDEAWALIKAGLVQGLSIGFQSLEDSRIKDTFSYHILRWRWLELSAVTIPAQSEASITNIKSADQPFLRAAFGNAPGRQSTPGASGTNRPASGHSRKATTMKTLQELREERTQKAARQSELMALRAAEERRFTPDEAKEFDTLNDEIAELDDDIRVKQYEETNARAAVPARGKSFDEGHQSRGGMIIVKKTDPDDKFKGQSFTRFLIAKAAAYVQMRDGNYVSPAEVAQHRWGKSHPNLVNWIKAAVAGGGTGSGEWGAELAQSDTRFSGDFVEFLYAATVFDRLPLRSVPANVHIKGQDGAGTGYWVGESKAIPVTKPDFSSVELTPLKVGAIAVCSKELVADSSPSAELWIRDSIVQASAQRVDTTFLSADAASAGVSPAGILNGLSAGVPSGTDAAAVRADLMTLYTGFLSAKNASGVVQIMTPAMAKALSMLVNSLGQTEFPGLNASGGTFLGDTVYTGDNVTPGHWILLKPSDIWKIGDTGIDVSMSDSAMVEQDSAPQGATDTPVAASATLVSLWQEDSVGFKVVRRINYAKRRASAVAYLADGEYGGVVS